MSHFTNILQYAKPYKRFAIGHIIANVYYALDVIFDKEKYVPTEKPVYTNLNELGDFAGDYLNYEMHQFTGGDKYKALMFTIGLIVVMFLLKNLFGYLANYFLVFLRKI